MSDLAPLHHRQRYHNSISIPALLIGMLFVCGGVGIYHLIPHAHAASAEELKQKIRDRADTIDVLEKEIAEYEKKLTTVRSEADSLKNTLTSLDLTNKKLAADIQHTSILIDQTNDDIDALSKSLNDKQTSVTKGREAVASSIRQLYEGDATSIVEIALSGKSLSDANANIQEYSSLWDHISHRTAALTEDIKTVASLKEKSEQKRATLIALTKDIEGQKQAVQTTAKEKQTVLAATKNQEANYKALLATKNAQKQQFERELFEAESALKILIDPKSLPSTGKGVLGWPLDKIIITQYFGTTAFSTQNPQVYNGKGHTGIDLGASIGTRIKASQNGIVAGTGDTDLIRGCYSYGKWVMIKHPNGLSTLYGHLSAITMKTGQEVTMGDTVGYSGNTGYSTGPHLHFGVYATAGVRIQPLANSKGCRNAVVPLADPSAYLNPLSYL
jgi:murein DD-endopeptidase MepM/ murein hydrolase activator NlpD